MVGAIDKSHYISSCKLWLFRAQSLTRSIHRLLSIYLSSISSFICFYKLITHMAKESLRPNDDRREYFFPLLLLLLSIRLWVFLFPTSSSSLSFCTGERTQADCVNGCYDGRANNDARICVINVYDGTSHSFIFFGFYLSTNKARRCHLYWSLRSLLSNRKSRTNHVHRRK